MSWRFELENRITELRDAVETHRDGDEFLQRVNAALDRATEQSASPQEPRERFWGWATGKQVEAGWANAHRAEELVPLVVEDDALDQQLMYVADHSPDLQAGSPARRNLASLHAKRRKNPQEDYTEEDRSVMSGILRTAHVRSTGKHQAVRSLRNRLYAYSLLLLLCAVILAAIGALNQRAIPLCGVPNPITMNGQSSSGGTTNGQGQESSSPTVGTCPTGRSAPSGGDVPLVEFLGIIGATVVGAATTVRARPRQTPYRIDAPQLILQISTGAITAVLGILALQHSILPGLAALTSSGQVLFYAVVFGAAQSAVTGVISARAESIVSAATSNEKPAGPDDST